MRFMMFMLPNIPVEGEWTPTPEAVASMSKFNEDLQKAGVLLALDGLHSQAEGVRISFSGGKRTITDGPFTEAKEMIGGYWIIDVKSKEEAVEWASRRPGEGCAIEIRQVFEMSEFPPEVQAAAGDMRLSTATMANIDLKRSIDAGAKDYDSSMLDRLDIGINLAKARQLEADAGMNRALAALREAMGIGLECSSFQLADLSLPDPKVMPERCDIVNLALARRGELMQVLIAADIFRGRYRTSFAHPEAMTPNQPLLYHFGLPTVNHVFLPGHRIMVQVQSTLFPLYDRNPQTFVPNIFDAKPADYQKETQRIWHAPDNASFINLPVVP